MLKTINFNAKSDILGSTASTLCLAHCLATPFLFAAHAGHVHGHHEHPFWWGVLDLGFIVLSMVAVYWSAKNTSKNWMRYALWLSWGFLAFVIINEKLAFVHIVEEIIYIPSLVLVALHLYNRKYCNCANESCCASD
ncbi:MerC domain-containing protein [Aureisphaera galaxeae]|uniref:MerC domain-containing protein n=1 Tax=Aureisphaera galaxeae TaxID=1538023 RepID=UPI002350BE0F|nr:MerC domain-containing protein [Aureisphaera galaxeae]MDC8005851.1 MerC domain-containing protein [Aureisphaera galaxeae]